MSSTLTSMLVALFGKGQTTLKLYCVSTAFSLKGQCYSRHIKHSIVCTVYYES